MIPTIGHSLSQLSAAFPAASFGSTIRLQSPKKNKTTSSPEETAAEHHGAASVPLNATAPLVGVAKTAAIDKIEAFNPIAPKTLPPVPRPFVHPTKPGQPRINALFISPEVFENKTGGLGEVATDSPTATAKHTRSDVRVLAPLLKTLAESGDYQSTGLSVTVPGRPIYNLINVKKYYARLETDTERAWFAKWMAPLVRVNLSPLINMLCALTPERYHNTITKQLSPKVTFELYQSKKNPQFYGLGNPKYTTGYKSLFYGYKVGKTDSADENAEFDVKRTKLDSLLLFNRAVKQVIPYLNGKDSLLQHPFDGGLDLLVMNDWPMTLVAYDDLKKDNPGLKTLFFLHNTYDMAEYADQVERVLPLPTKVNKLNNSWFSFFESGIRNADGVIANRNFVSTIAGTNFRWNAGYLPDFKTMIKQGKVHDIHHIFAETFHPAREPNLISGADCGAYAFSPEESKVLETYITYDTPENRAKAEAVMVKFKEKNKAALQKYTQSLPKEMGYLKTDPKAIVFTFVSRWDPSQKGFLMEMNCLDALMQKHPELQVGLFSTGDFGGIKEFREKMLSKYPGRIMIQGRFYNDKETALAHAGSDFNFMNSVFEPFGISQIKAMKMFAPSIGTCTDGLKSTMTDEAEPYRSTPGGPMENFNKYGQNGVFMTIPDAPLYYNAVNKLVSLSDSQIEGMKNGTYQYSYQERFDKLLPHEKQVVLDSDASFMDAMERSIKLIHDSKKFHQVQLNGYKYVTIEHSPETIAKRYFDIFMKSLGGKPLYFPESAATSQARALDVAQKKDAHNNRED